MLNVHYFACYALVNTCCILRAVALLFARTLYWRITLRQHEKGATKRKTETFGIIEEPATKGRHILEQIARASISLALRRAACCGPVAQRRIARRNAAYALPAVMLQQPER